MVFIIIIIITIIIMQSAEFFEERQIDFKVFPCGRSFFINYELTIETPYIECPDTWNGVGLCPFKNFTYLEFYFWLIRFTNCFFPPGYKSLPCQALLLLPLLSLYLFYFTKTLKNWLPYSLTLLFHWAPHSLASFWPLLHHFPAVNSPFRTQNSRKSCLTH